jgi:hypothetical protein
MNPDTGRFEKLTEGQMVMVQVDDFRVMGREQPIRMVATYLHTI